MFTKIIPYNLKASKKIINKKLYLQEEEINDPISSDPDLTVDINEVVEENITYDNKSKYNKKPKMKCSDDDYIEVPGGTESITWTDDEGQSYEISISDLQEYDGDDGEIEYTKSKKPITKLILLHKESKNNKKIYNKVPNILLAKKNIELSMLKYSNSRIYS